MDWQERTYQTKLAHIIHARPDLIEIRYRPGVTMDAEGVKEIHETRKRILGDRPYASLSIIPDNVDVELSITQRDHYSEEREKDPLLAWAVVACGSMLEMIAKLYFSRFQQVFPVLTTSDETEARAWIMAQLDRTRKSAG